MEPVEAKVERHRLKINYTLVVKVESIRWHNNPDGYFVHFEGSRESLNFGIEPPQWSEGDDIKITFERIDPCPPSPTTNQTNSSNSSSSETPSLAKPEA